MSPLEKLLQISIKKLKYLKYPNKVKLLKTPRYNQNLPFIEFNNFLPTKKLNDADANKSKKNFQLHVT